jgi:hypothetical protein
MLLPSKIDAIKGGIKFFNAQRKVDTVWKASRLLLNLYFGRHFRSLVRPGYGRDRAKVVTREHVVNRTGCPKKQNHAHDKILCFGKVRTTAEEFDEIIDPQRRRKARKPLPRSRIHHVHGKIEAPWYNFRFICALLTGNEYNSANTEHKSACGGRLKRKLDHQRYGKLEGWSENKGEGPRKRGARSPPKVGPPKRSKYLTLTSLSRSHHCIIEDFCQNQPEISTPRERERRFLECQRQTHMKKDLNHMGQMLWYAFMQKQLWE